MAQAAGVGSAVEAALRADDEECNFSEEEEARFVAAENSDSDGDDDQPGRGMELGNVTPFRSLPRHHRPSNATHEEYTEVPPPPVMHVHMTRGSGSPLPCCSLNLRVALSRPGPPACSVGR